MSASVYPESQTLGLRHRGGGDSGESHRGLEETEVGVQPRAPVAVRSAAPEGGPDLSYPGSPSSPCPSSALAGRLVLSSASRLPRPPRVPHIFHALQPRWPSRAPRSLLHPDPGSGSFQSAPRPAPGRTGPPPLHSPLPAHALPSPWLPLAPSLLQPFPPRSRLSSLGGQLYAEISFLPFFGMFSRGEAGPVGAEEAGARG